MFKKALVLCGLSVLISSCSNKNLKAIKNNRLGFMVALKNNRQVSFTKGEFMSHMAPAIKGLIPTFTLSYNA